jgi:hypothetical protein
MGKPFFFCGSHDLAVFDQAGRRIMERGINSKGVHVFFSSKSVTKMGVRRGGVANNVHDSRQFLYGDTSYKR